MEGSASFLILLLIGAAASHCIQDEDLRAARCFRRVQRPCEEVEEVPQPQILLPKVMTFYLTGTDPHNAMMRVTQELSNFEIFWELGETPQFGFKIVYGRTDFNIELWCLPEDLDTLKTALNSSGLQFRM